MSTFLKSIYDEHSTNNWLLFFSYHGRGGMHRNLDRRGLVRLMEYQPNYWQVVKITSTEGKVLYKVFATRVGGYVEGDSWRMNSGIESVKVNDNVIEFSGYSGSVYKCLLDEGSYRTSMYTQSVLESMIKKADLVGAKIEVLPFETNFEELL